MFTVFEAIGVQANGELEYRIVSKHRTMYNARCKIEKLALREQQRRWPRRPEMFVVILNTYEIHRTGRKQKT